MASHYFLLLGYLLVVIRYTLPEQEILKNSASSLWYVVSCYTFHFLI